MERQPTACVFCGDAPVPHRLHFLTSGTDIVLGYIFRPSTKKRPRFLQVTRSEIARLISRALLTLSELLGIVRYSSDPSRARSARTKSVWAEAERRGIQMQQLVIGGAYREEMRALLPRRKGSTRRSWHYFESIPIPPWLETETGGWIDDKDLFKKVFQEHRLSVARGFFTTTEQQALRAFRELGAPVITKPRSGSRARHTTVAIQTEGQLIEGFRRAKELCPFVMVEEFITGNLYRATCVNRKLVGVVKFVKPEVVADGTKTIDELLVYHNAHKKFSNLTDVKRDPWFFDAIAHQGYTPESVPAAGTHVLLSEHSERPNGGYFIDVTDGVSAKTVANIERAAEVCDVEIIGFDIISKDLTNPVERFVFIEGNTLPYIEIHAIPYEGKPRNVAAAVWDMWL
jgi:D-alanine-D-alanine ligase-like ATP-grasp enzyme